jgi:hypothetical protein
LSTVWKRICVASGACDGSLEGLLSLRPDAYLHVEAPAFDATSGARKYYSSKHYKVADIAAGTDFDGVTLVMDREAAGPPE